MKFMFGPATWLFSLALLVSALRAGVITAPLTLDLDSRYWGFFDNRVYFNTVQIPQTIYGGRLYVAGGPSLGSAHEVRVGFDYLHEFGSPHGRDEIAPVVFYHGKTPNVDFWFGKFPRGEIADFPRALFNDTLNYYRPEIEGTKIVLSNDIISQGTFVDWLTRQTYDAHEEFLLGTYGTARWGVPFVTDHLIYHHFAGRDRIIHDPVHESYGLHLAAGARSGKMGILDSCSVSAAFLGSSARTRGVTEWRSGMGGIGLVTLDAGRFGLSVLGYKGEAQQFDFMDTFYKARTYGRADINTWPVVSEHVVVKFTVALDYIEGRINSSQILHVVVAMGGKLKLADAKNIDGQAALPHP
jgi:hypothetical protein